MSKQFFEPETGIVTKIEQSLGVSTCEMSPQRRRCAPARRRRIRAHRRPQAPARRSGGWARARPARSARACSGIYLSVLVLLPVAALLAKAGSGGLDAFWREVTGPEAQAAIKLTLVVSAIVVCVNASSAR